MALTGSWKHQVSTIGKREKRLCSPRTDHLHTCWQAAQQQAAPLPSLAHKYICASAVMVFDFLKKKRRHDDSPRASTSPPQPSLTDEPPSPLPQAQPSQHQSLLNLPNEILLDIIAYLRPRGCPIAYIRMSSDNPSRPYYADRNCSKALQSMTRTCRRLHALVELTVEGERDLELYTFQYCQACPVGFK